MNALNDIWPDLGPPRRAMRPALFRGLKPREEARLRRACVETLYADGDVVPPARGFGLITQGVLREELGRGRDRRLFAVSFANELVPHTSHRRSPGTILAALGPTRVLACDNARLERLCEELPRLRENLLRAVQDQLEAARVALFLLARKSAAERVASFLHDVHRRQGFAGTLSIGLSRAEIGELLGLTLETVSRQIRALEKAGIIALPTPTLVRVNDPRRLELETGDARHLRLAA